MRAETRNRLWSAMLWTALAAALAGIVATAGAFDASVLLPVMATGGTPIPAVAWYRLDGNAMDSSENGNNGTITGASATTGRYGSALYFNGSNQFISISTVTMASNSFSVTYWMRDVNFSPAGRGNRVLANSASVTQTFGTPFATTFRIEAPSNDKRNDWTIPDVSGSEWHHVAVSSGASGAMVYVDGVPSESGSKRIAANVIADRIGKLHTATTTWQGAMDDLRIYDRALSPANIQRIMTGQDVEPIDELQ